jgi:hypothetical protein
VENRLNDGGFVEVIVGNAVVAVATSLETSVMREGMEEALTIHE